jgi:hypothetical protein
MEQVANYKLNMHPREHLQSMREQHQEVGVSSAVLNLTDQQLAALIQRGRGWPWNGYEPTPMKKAGKYAPQRLLARRR